MAFELSRSMAFNDWPPGIPQRPDRWL